MLFGSFYSMTSPYIKSHLKNTEIDLMTPTKEQMLFYIKPEKKFMMRQKLGH